MTKGLLLVPNVGSAVISLAQAGVSVMVCPQEIKPQALSPGIGTKLSGVGSSTEIMPPMLAPVKASGSHALIAVRNLFQLSD